MKQRLKKLEQTIAQRKRWLSAQEDKVKALRARLDTLPGTISRLQSKTATLEAAYREQGRVEKPHSKLAHARQRLASAQKKLSKTPQVLQQAQRAVATHQARLANLLAEHQQLSAHLTQLQANNAQNEDPVTLIVRVDAGFGTGLNITWLVEMGYIVYTKGP